MVPAMEFSQVTGSRPSVSDASTRARIVAAAERLFTQGGEEATSLRAITRAARVNVAAVHYHFGGRDELLYAVLEAKVGPLNARRMELLDAAVARHGDQVPVDVLLDAFLRPDLELLSALTSEEVRFARFMGRAYSQPSPAVARFVERQFGPVGDRLLPLLERSLPAVAPAEIRIRIRLVTAVITALFAAAVPAGSAGTHPLGTEDLEEQLQRLIAFLRPGLAAPSAALD
jgi:AcrR family transcriptional regulator